MNLKEIKKELERKKLQDIQEIQLEIDNFKGSLTIKDSIQQNVIESGETKYIVNGPAGSGKTILAMIKMLELEKLGEDYKVIIYTKALKSFLIGRMKRARFLDTENKVFHLDDLKFQKIKSDQYDYIIVDEVQDFSIEILDELLCNANMGYYLYGDENQSIYPENTGDLNIVTEIISKHEFEKFHLNKIYRFDRSIFNFANPINPNSKDVLIRDNIKEPNLTDCDTPKILNFNTREEELEYLLQSLKNTNWKDVAILLARNKDVEDVYRWFKFIKKYGKVEAKYYYNWDSNTRKYRDEHDDLDFSTTNVKIMTYHSSKGLEFDRVFIPICNVYEKEDEKRKYNYREALYVGFTRAKITLIVSYNNEDGKSEYLNKIPKDTYLPT